jgi:hypothetical protein
MTFLSRYGRTRLSPTSTGSTSRHKKRDQGFRGWSGPVPMVNAKGILYSHPSRILFGCAWEGLDQAQKGPGRLTVYSPVGWGETARYLQVQSAGGVIWLHASF